MNAVEIEEAVSDLANSPFVRQLVPLQRLLQARNSRGGNTGGQQPLLLNFNHPAPAGCGRGLIP